MSVDLNFLILFRARMRDDLLVKMQILSLVFKEYPPQSSQLQSVEFSSFSIKMINKHQCANTCTIAFLEEKSVEPLSSVMEAFGVLLLSM